MMDGALIGAIKAEAARRSVTHSQLAEALSISAQAMGRRLRGETEFTAGEVVAVARRLDVPVGLLYGEPV